MKRFLLAAIFCLMITSLANAQDTAASAPASKEDVERYLQTMHSHDMMLGMVASMAKPMHQMVHERYLKDKDRLPADFEARTDKIIDDMMKDMPFDEMTQAMVPTYQKHFTKADIDSLIAFYSSPTGQKVLRELPAVMGEAMQATMPIIRKHMDAVSEQLKQEIADTLKNSQK